MERDAVAVPVNPLSDSYKLVSSKYANSHVLLSYFHSNESQQESIISKYTNEHDMKLSLKFTAIVTARVCRNKINSSRGLIKNSTCTIVQNKNKILSTLIKVDLHNVSKQKINK
jgi:hypothetical protein